MKLIVQKPGLAELSTSLRLALMAEKLLEVDLTLNCALLPTTECRKLLDASSEEKNCHDREAAALAKQLMGFFRRADFEEPEIFFAGLSATFGQFPLSIGQQVVDPLKGLPATLRFPPTIADVRAALSDAIAKRRAIHYRAKWMLEERERRNAMPQGKATMSAEQRQELVDRLMGSAQKMENTA